MYRRTLWIFVLATTEFVLNARAFCTGIQHHSCLTQPFRLQTIHNHDSRAVKLRAKKVRRATELQAAWIVTTYPTVGASTALLVSAYAGTFSERRIMENSSILVTLLTATICSNRIAPRTHALYDACWSTVLPMSLALLLLSLRRSHDPTVDGALTALSPLLLTVQRLAVPFLLSCVGSVLGCIVAFLLFSHTLPFAAPAASCLAASFVGGSVNFFATAAALGRSSDISWVSSMAAADIVVMAVYFAVLSTSLQSPRLWRWFGDNGETANEDAKDDAEEDTSRKEISMTTDVELSRLETLVSGALVCTIAYGLVQLAKVCEKGMDTIVPGTACAFLAAMIPALTNVLPNDNHLWKSMQTVAKPLSALCFLLLFGAIGMSVDLEATVFSGPACLVFSLVALCVHGLVVLFGSYALRHSTKASLSDVLVASNAAIGGPATAAAFCGQVTTRSSNERRSLTFAATVWGVVGYAMGTSVGVLMFRVLRTLR